MGRLNKGRKIYDKGSFFFRILNSDGFVSWINGGRSFLDDVALVHWARKTFRNKRKQVVKSATFISSRINRSWEYFCCTIAKKLKSKKLAL